MDPINTQVLGSAIARFLSEAAYFPAPLPKPAYPKAIITLMHVMAAICLKSFILIQQISYTRKVGWLLHTKELCLNQKAVGHG